MREFFQDRLESLDQRQGYKKPDRRADATKMDSNENMAVPKSLQQEILRVFRGKDVREYPIGGVERLTQAIAEHLRVKPSRIGVGNGSDQILDLILSLFATSKTRVLAPEPTFSFFQRRCELYSIPMKGVAFSDDMKLNADELVAAAKDTDIIYIDSPNNPTGFQLPREDITEIVDGFDGLVIVDEAYADFGDYSLAQEAIERDNLVITRTFSKSHGLAGLRLGYMVAGDRFADIFNRVIQYPYPINALAIEAGITALSRQEQIQETIHTIQRERQRVIDVLRQYGAFKVFDSSGNFVLFDAGAAYRRVHRALEEQGVSVKMIGKVGRYEGCLRVTIGTKRMNSKFLLAVRDLLR